MSKSAIENFRPSAGKAEEISVAIAALKHGEAIAFPTETLYGLGADALNVAAVEKIYRLKGRDPTNPIPLLVADRAMVAILVSEIPPLAERLITEFWPGPLTLVLPARRDIPGPLLNSCGGVGIRISSQPIATELVQRLGRPLTATSANPSGKPPAHTVEEARNYFAADIAVFVDGGPLVSKTGSTVAAISHDKITIMREGEIARRELEKIVGKDKIAP
ncbi:MAG TPA: L-threonylcarbamoyladenylate synthase [Candidatus Binatia bacterium]